MDADIDLWRLVAGLGLFLYGMYQLERALQHLAGRPFKQFLRQHTAHPARGVLTGVVATAALQSSSVVGLIVLALVGAGIIPLAAAVSVVFGSNLGTTATGWLVATLGFKLDINAFALPILAAGAFGFIWTRRGTRRHRFAQLALGFGLLLIGLDYMKGGTSDIAELFDPEALAAYPAIVFLIVGLLITAVIQSSSATITITLGALYAEAIPLKQAAAVAIGADIGTTVTILLGTLAGSAVKKRVAAALIIFNLVTDAMAFLLLTPLLRLITGVIGLADPLYALVAFHSLFNLLGITLFFPLIGTISRRLDGWFSDADSEGLRHLAPTDVNVPSVAIDNLELETRRLIDQVAAFAQCSFGLPPSASFYGSSEDRKGVALFQAGPDLDEAYLGIKRLEGAITEIALDLERQSLDADDTAKLRQSFAAVRDAVHAAKCVRDTRHDLKSFRDSVNDTYHGFQARFRESAAAFYQRLNELRELDTTALILDRLVAARQVNESLHQDIHRSIYEQVNADALASEEISTVLNVNRELFNANQGLLFALADALLERDSADAYRSIPEGR